MRAILAAWAFTALIIPRAEAQTCSASVCYTYDSYGRLVTATYGNGTTQSYTYDNTDNILSKTATCASTGC